MTASEDPRLTTLRIDDDWSKALPSVRWNVVPVSLQDLRRFGNTELSPLPLPPTARHSAAWMVRVTLGSKPTVPRNQLRIAQRKIVAYSNAAAGTAGVTAAITINSGQ